VLSVFVIFSVIKLFCNLFFVLKKIDLVFVGPSVQNDLRPSPGSFDLIICGTMHLLPSVHNVLQTLQEITTPVWILQHFNYAHNTWLAR